MLKVIKRSDLVVMDITDEVRTTEICLKPGVRFYSSVYEDPEPNYCGDLSSDYQMDFYLVGSDNQAEFGRDTAGNSLNLGPDFFYRELGINAVTDRVYPLIESVQFFLVEHEETALKDGRKYKALRFYADIQLSDESSLIYYLWVEDPEDESGLRTSVSDLFGFIQVDLKVLSDKLKLAIKRAKQRERRLLQRNRRELGIKPNC